MRCASCLGIPLSLRYLRNLSNRNSIAAFKSFSFPIATVVRETKNEVTSRDIAQIQHVIVLSVVFCGDTAELVGVICEYAQCKDSRYRSRTFSNSLSFRSSKSIIHVRSWVTEDPTACHMQPAKCMKVEKPTCMSTIFMTRVAHSAVCCRSI